MKKALSFLLVTVLFALIAVTVWYVPSSRNLRFRLEEAKSELATSLQREKKQQYEYDEVIADLPLVRTELAEVQPLADALTAETDALKEEKKQLKNTIKEWKNQSAAGSESLKGGSQE